MKDVQVTVRLESELKSLAEQIAREKGKELQDLISELLELTVRDVYPERLKKLSASETPEEIVPHSIKEKMLYSDALTAQAEGLDTNWT